MKWYQYTQCNSGGHMVRNKIFGDEVFIEASSAEIAEKFATSIGIYFDGVNAGIDCPCCGDRWTRIEEGFNDWSIVTFPNDDLDKPIDNIIDYAREWVGFRDEIAIIYYDNGSKDIVTKDAIEHTSWRY